MDKSFNKSIVGNFVLPEKELLPWQKVMFEKAEQLGEPGAQLVRQDMRCHGKRTTAPWEKQVEEMVIRQYAEGAHAHDTMFVDEAGDLNIADFKIQTVPLSSGEVWFGVDSAEPTSLNDTTFVLMSTAESVGVLRFHQRCKQKGNYWSKDLNEAYLFSSEDGANKAGEKLYRSCTALSVTEVKELKGFSK